MIRAGGLRKEFRGTVAVADISFEVREGETLVLLGTSGCGKTTTLRMINRLIGPTAGTIQVNGREIADEDPVLLRRMIGYMIQGVGLFPHRTVEENILAVPGLLGWSRERGQSRLRELLELVNLPQAMLGRFPNELSGGQRQRVGLARALAADPPIILMDEPFGALDPLTRQQVRGEFRRMESLMRKTIVLVTHDVTEALELGDRICLMAEGRIAQLGTAAELLFQPRTEFVRTFFDANRMHNEWMATRLAELPELTDVADGLRAAGHPDGMTVFEALSILEGTDEAGFHRTTAAFFEFKRRSDSTVPEGGPEC
jgi:osmoprotectant transport system ATP-binding protein